jgi:hypothetical protein
VFDQQLKITGSRRHNGACSAMAVTTVVAIENIFLMVCSICTIERMLMMVMVGNDRVLIIGLMKRVRISRRNKRLQQYHNDEY